MLLLNLYCNLSLFNPALQNTNFGWLKSATIGIWTLENTQPKSDIGEKIDNLLRDYKKKLDELKAIKEEEQALKVMNGAATTFTQRAQVIALELKNQLQGLSPKEVQQYKEKLLVNPLFKQINDARWAYINTGRLEGNRELEESFLAMESFMRVIYN